MSENSRLRNFIMKALRWVGRYSGVAALISFALYIYLLWAGMYYTHWGQSTATESIPILLKVCYGIWTIGVPLFFLAEYSAHAQIRPDEAPEARSERLDELKTFQQLARDVWLACAAVAGFLIFKIG